MADIAGIRILRPGDGRLVGVGLVIMRGCRGHGVHGPQHITNKIIVFDDKINKLVTEQGYII